MTSSVLQSMARSTRSVAGAAAAVLALTSLAACGGSDEPETNAEGQTKINVSVISTFDASPLLVGVEEGIFEDHGLDVEISFAEGGAAIIPGVLSGDNQFGYSNIISELAAIDQDLPITLVASAWSSPSNVEDDDYGILVKPDSGIETPADLADANIAVNTLQNIGEVTIRMALENEGVNADNVTFTQLNYADMYDALDRGDVDAVWFPEPFLQQGIQRGWTRVLSPGVTALPDAVGGYYLASQQYAAENPDTVQAFKDALAEANEFATANPDLVRQSAVDDMGFDAEATASANLPPYPNLNDGEATRAYAQASIEYGIIEEEPDYDAIFWSAE